jgi:hypothetical protein
MPDSGSSDHSELPTACHQYLRRPQTLSIYSFRSRGHVPPIPSKSCPSEQQLSKSIIMGLSSSSNIMCFRFRENQPWRKPRQIGPFLSSPSTRSHDSKPLIEFSLLQGCDIMPEDIISNAIGNSRNLTLGFSHMFAPNETPPSTLSFRAGREWDGVIHLK